MVLDVCRRALGTKSLQLGADDRPVKGGRQSVWSDREKGSHDRHPFYGGKMELRTLASERTGLYFYLLCYSVACISVCVCIHGQECVYTPGHKCVNVHTYRSVGEAWTLEVLGPPGARVTERAT